MSRRSKLRRKLQNLQRKQTTLTRDLQDGYVAKAAGEHAMALNRRKLHDAGLTDADIQQRMSELPGVPPRTSFNLVSEHEHKVCDVCGSLAIAWRYPVEPWTDQLVEEARRSLPELGHRNAATWLTCERCSRVADANDTEQLKRITRAALERSFTRRTLDLEDEAARDDMRAAIELRIDDFMANRRGPKERISAAPVQRQREADRLIEMVRRDEESMPGGHARREGGVNIVQATPATFAELNRQRLPGETDNDVLRRALLDAHNVDLAYRNDLATRNGVLIRESVLDKRPGLELDADSDPAWSKAVATLRQHPGTLAIVCDFCGSPSPSWRYPVKPWRDALTNVVFPRPNITIREHDTDTRRDPLAWYACDACTELVESGTASVLVLRALESSRRAYGDPAASGASDIDMALATGERVNEFFKHRNGPREPWSLGGGLFEQKAPRRISTVDLAPLPDVGPYSDALVCQLKLRDFWKSPAALDMVIGAKVDEGQRYPVEILQAFTSTAADVLERAVTYYVAPQIADFLNGSAASVPDDAAFTPEDLPAPCGFLYLVNPYESQCTNPAGHESFPGQLKDGPQGQLLHSPAFHNVRAIAWDFSAAPDNAVRVGVDETLPDDEIRLIFNPPKFEAGDLGQVNVYLYVDSRSGAAIFRDHFSWPEGARVDSSLRKVAATGYSSLTEAREGVRLLIDPVRKLLVAAWSFISQQVAEQAERPANGITRKRLEQARQHRDVHRPIRIIYLRREEHKAAAARVVGDSDREYHCLWWRRPHKRLVPYGPIDVAPRPKRLKWIRGQICGPSDPAKREGLPLKPTRAIYALVK